jgi:hypothetical protein
MGLNERLAGELITAVIFKSDDDETIAVKIFNDFKVNQSCTIDGWKIKMGSKCGHNKYKPGRIWKRGEFVWGKILELDKIRYWTRDGKRLRRKHVNNSMGHMMVERKIFKFQETEFQGEPRFTIWRVQ